METSFTADSKARLWGRRFLLRGGGGVEISAERIALARSGQRRATADI